MRLSAFLLVLALFGVLFGGWLIGRAALGGAVIFDSLVLGYWALERDDGSGARPSVHEVPTAAQVLDRFRRAS